LASAKARSEIALSYAVWNWLQSTAGTATPSWYVLSEYPSATTSAVAPFTHLPVTVNEPLIGNVAAASLVLRLFGSQWTTGRVALVQLGGGLTRVGMPTAPSPPDGESR